MSLVLLSPERSMTWSVASRTAPGETVCGDLHLVCPWEEGVLIAAVDGLGHGHGASVAARAAISILAARPHDPVITLVNECHRALRSTRGAVMTLVSVNAHDNMATVLGVGNVEAVLLRANPRALPRRESALLRSGVVGCELPLLQATQLTFSPGDVVVLATDGIREDFAQQITADTPPQHLVEGIMARNYRGSDDGLVLACKYLGSP